MTLSHPGELPSLTPAEANYPVWTPQHESIVRGILDRDLYAQLYGATTPHGYSVDKAIQSAVDMPLAQSVAIGAVAGDAESYTLFAGLFDPVIEQVPARACCCAWLQWFATVHTCMWQAAVWM